MLIMTWPERIKATQHPAHLQAEPGVRWCMFCVDWRPACEGHTCCKCGAYLPDLTDRSAPAPSARKGIGPQHFDLTGR